MNLSRTKKGILAAGLLAFVGCSKQNGSPYPGITIPVTAENPSAQTSLGDGKNNYSVLGENALAQLIHDKKIALVGSPEASARLKQISEPMTITADDAATVASPAPVARDASLTVSFPMGLIKEQQVFGGVITAVSDKNSQDLGQLKLTDLPPVHVRTILADLGDGKYALVLVGCADKCTEGSEEGIIGAIPVSGVDAANNQVLLDLASLGDELNLIQMLDPDGKVTKLKTKTSRVVAVDYSFSTLVFDVEVVMVPLVAPTTGPVPETTFTVRWYLKLASAFHPSFEPRNATDGVGFFLTTRSATPKIQRFPLPLQGAEPVNVPMIKYYVKNVPEQFKPAFASAFDEWNTKFVDMTGKKMLTYEFVDASDPRSALLIPGDVRYNIVEWDLVNAAPYGGLGPSIANQFTGENFTANVLVQGPHIVDMYTKWFATAEHADILRANGNAVAADQLLRDAVRENQREAARSSGMTFAVTLGTKLSFRVTSQMPPLADPIDPNNFEPIPTGATFDNYMPGYFHDMLTHELGHDLGLRHNFRGNLGAASVPSLGKVSISIMEYLPRSVRQLDEIGPYDIMAINYGYKGIQPTIRTEYCTDEDVPDADNVTKSAECSRDDVGLDPFSYFLGRLKRVSDLSIGRGQSNSPLWTVDDLKGELGTTVPDIGFYASSAEATGSTWTNFFTGGDRPATPAEVKPYVVAKIRSLVCPADLTAVLGQKDTDDTRTKTVANLTSVRVKIEELLKPLKILGETDLKCP